MNKTPKKNLVTVICYLFCCDQEGKYVNIIRDALIDFYHLKNETVKMVFYITISVSYTHLDVYKRQPYGLMV